MRVLVVEDHPKTASLIAQGLREAGYAVDLARTVCDASWFATQFDYDSVVLDVMLPDGDGLELVGRLRQHERWAPILLLTARSSVYDRVRGLDQGADDYLVKPFSFDELLARLRALTRRGTVPRPATLEVGDLSVDPAARSVQRGSTAVHCTPKEFALLELLARRAATTLTRREILEHCWDFAFEGDPNILEVNVLALRNKIGRSGGTRSKRSAASATA